MSTMTKEERDALVRVLTACTPAIVEATYLRTLAKELRTLAPLYDKLLPGAGQKALAEAGDYEARARAADLRLDAIIEAVKTAEPHP